MSQADSDVSAMSVQAFLSLRLTASLSLSPGLSLPVTRSSLISSREVRVHPPRHELCPGRLSELDDSESTAFRRNTESRGRSS